MSQHDPPAPETGVQRGVSHRSKAETELARQSRLRAPLVCSGTGRGCRRSGLLRGTRWGLGWAFSPPEMPVVYCVLTVPGTKRWQTGPHKTILCFWNERRGK